MPILNEKWRRDLYIQYQRETKEKRTVRPRPQYSRDKVRTRASAGGHKSVLEDTGEVS